MRAAVLFLLAIAGCSPPDAAPVGPPSKEPPAWVKQGGQDLLEELLANQEGAIPLIGLQKGRILQWGPGYEFGKAHRAAMARSGRGVKLYLPAFDFDKVAGYAQEVVIRRWTDGRPDDAYDVAFLIAFGEDKAYLGFAVLRGVSPAITPGRWMERIPADPDATP